MVNKILEFVVANRVAFALGAAYFFVAFANSIPDPDDPRPFGVKVYATLYTLIHLLSNKVVEKRPALAPIQVGGTSQTINVAAPKETK